MPFLLLSGCLERRVRITTEPPGAVVVVNDTEVGRTPCATAFTYYGTYDVRIHKDGYNPITVGKEASAPWYEYPVIDIFATAAPARIKTVIDWHWELTPVTTGPDPELVVRARELRTQLGENPAEPPPPAEVPGEPGG